MQKKKWSVRINMQTIISKSQCVKKRLISKNQCAKRLISKIQCAKKDESVRVKVEKD